MDHTGVGWVMQGWGESCRGRVDHIYSSGVGHAGVGWCGDEVGHVGVGWVMVGWMGHTGVGSGGSYRGGIGWVMNKYL